MTATITTPVEAAQAVEQLGRVYASLAALRQQLEPLNPRNFAILAEGHVEEIRSLLQQLDEYAGVSAGVARRVRALARVKRASTSRVIAELVESGLGVQDAERERFLQLADRLTKSKDAAEQERIKEELARLTFGD